MKKIFTFLLALVASVSAIYASDTQVDGIWYDFDESNKTATVTYRGSSYSNYSNEYTGNITIPASVNYNGTTYSVTSIGKRTFQYCSSLTSVTIPNSVTSIGDYAFINCSSLISVTIGNSVTSIGNAAFADCSSLNLINVDIKNPNYCSIDGVLFNKDKTTLIQYPGGKQGAYTIPNSVTSIENYTFSGCSSLTSVTIPNSVTSIEKYTFSGCSSLISVTIGNSVTSIGDGAFYNCSSLTSVTIPNSVTSIGNSAFYRCSSLTSVTIPNSMTTIGEGAFNGCDKLVDVYCYATTPPATGGEDTFSHYNAFLYVPCESKKAYMVNAVWGNFKYIECISSEGIEDVQGDEVQSTKVIKDGQIFILRNGKMYTMQGQEVK